MPTSIELDKGPSGTKWGIMGVRKTKMESIIVPGNAILRASICIVRLLRESNIMAEKYNIKRTEFTTKVIRVSKSAANTLLSPFREVLSYLILLLDIITPLLSLIFVIHARLLPKT